MALRSQGGDNRDLPAPLRVYLSESEDRELLEFQRQPGVPQRVKERAEIVRLNHYGLVSGDDYRV